VDTTASFALLPGGGLGSLCLHSNSSDIRFAHLYTVLALLIVSHSRLVVFHIVGLLHQPYCGFRSRLDRTFERFGIPDLTSRDGQRYNHNESASSGNIPNEKTVEFSFGRLRISILAQRRLNVERREDASNGEVHNLESKASARTDPREYDYSPPWEGE